MLRSERRPGARSGVPDGVGGKGFEDEIDDELHPDQRGQGERVQQVRDEAEGAVRRPNAR